MLSEKVSENNKKITKSENNKIAGCLTIYLKKSKI